MEVKDVVAIIAVVLSLIALWQSLRRERRASQESVIKALQGEKEAVMYIAYKATSEKWRKQLRNDTFRDEITTAMCLAFIAEPSNRAKALIFAALRLLKKNYSESVRTVLATLHREFTTYNRGFNPTKFEERIKAIETLAKALGLSVGTSVTSAGTEPIEGAE